MWFILNIFPKIIKVIQCVDTYFEYPSKLYIQLFFMNITEIVRVAHKNVVINTKIYLTARPKNAIFNFV